MMDHITNEMLIDFLRKGGGIPEDWNPSWCFDPQALMALAAYRFGEALRRSRKESSDEP